MMSPPGDTPSLRARPIVCVRIRNVNRPIKLAVLVPAVEDVLTLGGPVISLLRFRASRVATQRDFVSFDHTRLMEERKRAFSLYDYDFVGTQIGYRAIPGFRNNA